MCLNVSQVLVILTGVAILCHVLLAYDRFVCLFCFTYFIIIIHPSPLSPTLLTTNLCDHDYLFQCSPPAK